MPKPKRRTPIVPFPKPSSKPATTQPGQHNPKKSLNKQNNSNTFKTAKPCSDGRRDGFAGQKRPRDGLKGQAEASEPVKRRKYENTGTRQRAGSGARPGSGTGHGHWRCLSVVHQQAAFAVQRLLEADSSRRHGASLKSLTLAPHIEAKKATYAVTCQVLKFSQILEQLDSAVGLSAGSPKLGKYVAMVLSYELLRGQGLTRKGPAERAVLAAEPRLRAALEGMQKEAGVQTMDELLASQQGGDGAAAAAGPAVPHPRWVRVNTLKADVADVVRQLEAHVRATSARAGSRAAGEGAEASDGGGSGGEEDSEGGTDGDGAPNGHNGLSDGGGASGGRGRVVRDPLLPDLLALPPGTDLHAHPLVTRGSAVLQSKASCMPAHALAPAPGWTVVDCCAAPGNKTTHLAAIMGNTGRVIAFDKDPKRLARLRDNAARTGAACISPRLADFLSVDPLDPEYAQVRGVLLDPSCSGSGTTFTRMDHLLPSHAAAAATRAGADAGAAASKAPGGGGGRGGRQQGADGAGTQAAPEGKMKGRRKEQAGEQSTSVAGAAAAVGGEEQQEGSGGEEEAAAAAALSAGPADPAEAGRVAQLARFQAAALAHALRFPGLQRLVYSTCSVHAAENEGVVAGALPAAREAGFELVDPFPSWPRRGLPLFPGAEKLVRTDAYQDGTDGFFVAVFERAAAGPGGAGEEAQEQELGEEGGLQAPQAAKRKSKAKNKKQAKQA